MEAESCIGTPVLYQLIEVWIPYLVQKYTTVQMFVEM